MQTVTEEYLLKANIRHSTLPKEIIEESPLSYTPPFIDGGNGQVITGLSLDEQDLLLPNLIGTSLSSPEYRDKVRDFFADFTIYIPKDGLHLNGTYKMEEGSEMPLPVNVNDYILIRMLKEDNNCSKAPETDAIHFFDYILEDKQKNKEREDNSFKMEMEASTQLVKLLSDEGATGLSTVKTLVTILKDVLNLSVSDIIDYDEITLKRTLTKIKDKDPKRFLKEAKNEGIELKAIVIQGIDLGTITLAGEEYYFEELKLGKSVEVAVRVLKTNTEAHAKIISSNLKRLKEIKN